MHYMIVLVAVVLFGIQFLCDSRYSEVGGHGLTAIMFFMLGGSIVNLPIMLALNGFRLEFTPFTLLMATIAVLNGMACSICSLKSLARINLSLYSIFSMLGGMLLPFVFGIFFYDEPFTIGKALCFILITVSLVFTFKKGEDKGGWIYYMGIFVFNGLSGVISKIYTSAAFPKATEAGYSILSSLVAIVIAGVILLLFGKKKDLPAPRAYGFILGSGGLNKVANYLLLLSLAQLPASVQYPMVTGGVMIVSTVIALFTHKKPGKRELFSVLFAFAGILAVTLIP